VQVPGNTYLHLDEVEVFATAEPSQNLAFDQRLLDAARKAARETRDELAQDADPGGGSAAADAVVRYGGNYAIALEESNLELSRAKEAARRTTDISALRQVGIASVNYASDNQGWFPWRGGRQTLSSMKPYRPADALRGVVVVMKMNLDLAVAGDHAPPHRVERNSRFLEHVTHHAAADPPQLCVRHPQHVLPVQQDRSACVVRRRRGQQPGD
jgi:hypothetical protein